MRSAFRCTILKGRRLLRRLSQLRSTSSEGSKVLVASWAIGCPFSGLRKFYQALDGRRPHSKSMGYK